MPQEKILRFQNAAKGILSYKISAARDFFQFQSAAKGFYLTKPAPQEKILRFQSAAKGILPSKMSAAGEKFAVSERC